MCSKCYRDDNHLGFHIDVPLNDEGNKWARSGSDPDKSLVGRDGDWLMCPFQCEHCLFVNAEARVPLPSSLSDSRILSLLRRANLDAFWSREPSTVAGFLGHVKYIIKAGREIGITIPLEKMEPWPLSDRSFGSGIATIGLTKSLGTHGKNSKTHLQFDTVRKLRSAANTIYESTARGSEDGYTFKKVGGSDILHVNEGPTQSIWYVKFALGMKRRMGQVTNRNKPLTSEVLKLILAKMENEMYEDSASPDHARLLIMAGVYFVTVYGSSLRGNEGFMMDAQGLCNHISVGARDDKVPHVLVPLLGKFKGECGERLHVLPMASVTSSGIKIRAWLELLVKLLEHEGKTDGPALCDAKEGYLMRSSEIEAVFHDQLEWVQQAFPDLIPPGVEVRKSFGVYRSFRRGATSTAVGNGVDDTVVNLVNRWRKFEMSKCRNPGFKMMDHYLENSGVLYRHLLFSQSL